MIIGVCQLAADDPTKVWDYVGCPFPEGYLGPDKTYLFNDESEAGTRELYDRLVKACGNGVQ